MPVGVSPHTFPLLPFFTWLDWPMAAPVSFSDVQSRPATQPATCRTPLTSRNSFAAQQCWRWKSWKKWFGCDCRELCPSCVDSFIYLFTYCFSIWGAVSQSDDSKSVHKRNTMSGECFDIYIFYFFPCVCLLCPRQTSMSVIASRDGQLSNIPFSNRGKVFECVKSRTDNFWSFLQSNAGHLFFRNWVGLERRVFIDGNFELDCVLKRNLL